MTELSSTRSETQPPTHTWGEAPLVDLIEHILITYHHPLRADLDTAVALAERVAQVHGPRDASGRLARLSGCVTLLRGELLLHLQKEEQVLFPWLRAGRGRTAGAPVAVMQHEHRAAEELLVQIQALTGDFVVPAGACAKWTALWQLLERLQRELREHITLEDKVLFPRALAG